MPSSVNKYAYDNMHIKLIWFGHGLWTSFFYRIKFYRNKFRVNTAKAVNKWSSVHIVQYTVYTQ